MSSSYNLLLTVLFTAVLFSWTVHGALEQAQSANEFADSVCVNTHLGATHYSQNLTFTRQLLLDAGVFNIRDHVPTADIFMAQMGIKTNFFLGPASNIYNNITSTQGLVSSLKGTIQGGMLCDAILGTNEPNIFWPRTNTVSGISSRRTPKFHSFRFFIDILWRRMAKRHHPVCERYVQCN